MTRVWMKRLLFLPVIIYSLIIIYLSNQPYLDYPRPDIEFWDKIVHAGAYFVYGILLIIAVLAVKPQIPVRKFILIILIIGGVFGISDETHQYFIPGRDADILDWIADLTGIGLSLIFLKLIRKQIKIISGRQYKD